MSRKTPRAKVGVIGLGIIGSRAAANLRAAGHQVYVWSRTPRAEPNFLGSVVEVADLSDVVQLFVSDDAALLETVRTMAPALGPRHIVCGHCTVSPEAAREAAGLVTARGARYLDAPFTGSRNAAQAGQLVYYVAGSDAALREARPILEGTSKAVVFIGETPGQASVVKIATNMLAATLVQTLAEALAVSRAAGVEDGRFTEALENNGSRSGISDIKLPGMLKGDFETHFSLKHMLKDARLALRLASSHGINVPATATVAAALYGGVQRGWGEQDFSILAKNYDPRPPAAPVVTAMPEHVPASGMSVLTPASPPAPEPPAPTPDLPAPVAEEPAPAPAPLAPTPGASAPLLGLPAPPPAFSAPFPAFPARPPGTPAPPSGSSTQAPEPAAAPSGLPATPSEPAALPSGSAAAATPVPAPAAPPPDAASPEPVAVAPTVPPSAEPPPPTAVQPGTAGHLEPILPPTPPPPTRRSLLSFFRGK